MRRAQTQLFVDMGVLRPARGARARPCRTGVFGGYLYMNASAMRLFGVRMPGMTPATAEEQVTGTVEELPPYRRQKGDRNLAATLAISRLSFTPAPPPRPRQPRRGAARRRGAGRPRCPTSTQAADAELLAWMHTYPPRLGASMRRLLESSMLGAAPRGHPRAARRAPTRRDPGLVNRIVAGTGDVDSAQPARRLWTLSRLVAGDPDLTADLRRRARRHRRADGRHRAASPSIDAFLRDHGHRGNDEYELASPAWVMDPRPVYASIDRLRHVPDERDPERDRRSVCAPTPTPRWPRPSGSRPSAPPAGAPSRHGRPASAASHASGPRTSSCARTSPPDGCCTSWCAGPPSAADRPIRAWRSA